MNFFSLHPYKTPHKCTSLPTVLVVLALLATSFGSAVAQNTVHFGLRAAQVTKALDLSTDQQAQLKPLLRGTMQQVRAIRTDPTLTPEQRFDRIRIVREQTRTQVNQILTPAQQQKLKDLRRQFRAEHTLPQPTAPAPEQGTQPGPL